VNATIRVVSVVLLASVLSGCTGGAPSGTATSAPPGVVLAAVSGSELGNGRPIVSYDGLMVRRRIVVAVHPTPDADLGMLRTALYTAAGGRGLTLSEISPDVLGAGVLQHMVPELIVVLPSDATAAEGGELVDLAFTKDRAFPGLDHVHIASVLVHDLRFTVGSADPAAVAEAITLEGILSDSLGKYETVVDGRELEIGYTGPLLSDTTVESVRGGIARGAGVAAEEVTVSPRSGTGAGVDMDKEPLEEAVPEDATDHDHAG
jgi:hypothetical protein